MMTINWPLGDSHTRLVMRVGSGFNQILDLTNVDPANIHIKMRRNVAVSRYIWLAGTVTLLIPAAGLIAFQFAPLDVAIPGNYYLVVAISFAVNDTWNSFEMPLAILGP